MIGNNLKEILKERRITSKELADKLGISQTHMSYILNEKRRPSFELLDAMCDVLGVTMSRITADREDPKNEFMVKEEATPYTVAASRKDGYKEPVTEDEAAAVDAFLEAYRRIKHDKKG